MNKTIKKTARICFGMLLGALITFAPQMTQAQVNRRGKAATTTPATRNNRAAPAKKPGNVNVNNNNKNVNINVNNNVRVNNSRHTTVRHSPRPYVRAPHVYGGRRYMCHHPYVFHPFRPFIWGPRWHPWGFFITTLATTAIILSIVENDMPADIDIASNFILGNGNYPAEGQLVLSGPYNGFNPEYQVHNYTSNANVNLNIADEYWYDEGTYYLKTDGGYTVVSAPLGAKIKTLPSGYETITLDDKSKNYYYGGTFYEKSSTGYTVVAPIAGSVVEHVSEGAEEVTLGDQKFVKMGETYFQPIQENGKDMYEVADVEEDK
jgi:Family of unknown function (DUF6515)